MSRRSSNSARHTLPLPGFSMRSLLRRQFHPRLSLPESKRLSRRRNSMNDSINNDKKDTAEEQKDGKAKETKNPVPAKQELEDSKLEVSPDNAFGESRI